jgi:hypothetical protein
LVCFLLTLRIQGNPAGLAFHAYGIAVDDSFV